MTTVHPGGRPNEHSKKYITYFNLFRLN